MGPLISISIFALARSIAPSPLDSTSSPRPSSYELRWSAPASCPSLGAIERRIESMLEDPGDGGVLYVDGRVRRERDRYVLQWSTTFEGIVDPRASVTSTRCEDLTESLALTVAITLDPGAALANRTDAQPEAERQVVPPPAGTPPLVADEPTRSPAPSPSSSPSATEAAPTAASPASPASSARRSRPIPPTVSIHLAPSLTLGDLPRVGGGTRAGVSVSWPQLRLWLGGAYLWPQRNSTQTGLFQMGVADLAACGRLWAEPVEFPLCAGVEAGAVRADSRRLVTSNTRIAPWFAATAGAGAMWRIGRVGLWSLVQGIVPAVVPQFSVGQSVVFRPSAVTFRASLGVEFFFGTRDARSD